MINNKELSILEELKQKNEQTNLQNIEFKRSMSNGVIDSIDSSLAAYIYCFFTKKINGLPSTEYVDNIINESQRNIELSKNIISIGYGFILSLMPETKNIKIEYETPISDASTRIDIITSSNYEAYKIIENTGTYGNTLKNIDTNKEPVFNSKRVKILQQYLKEYETIKQNKSGIKR